MKNFGGNKTDESDSVEIQPPGFRLRRAREACELSCEDVATHLKLSVEKIESLERGEVENIAAPVFVAGYLRSYARLVNLSGDDIVADFKKLTAMKSPSMDPASSPAAHDYGQVGNASSLNMSLSGNNGLGSTLIVGTVAVILVVAGYVYFTDSEEISTKKNDNFEVSSGKISSQDKVSKTMSTKLLPKESSPGNEELAKKAARKNIPAPFSASLKEGTNTSVLSELTFYFNEESWVDVKDSRDKRLLYRIGKEGVSRTVAGLAPFNVRLGFVNGVNIIYNGKLYDLSRFKNRKSARFQVGKKGDRIGGGE